MPEEKKQTFIARKPFAAEGKKYVGGDKVECREGTMTSLINRGLVATRDEVKEDERAEKEATAKREAEAKEAKAAEAKAAKENK